MPITITMKNGKIFHWSDKKMVVDKFCKMVYNILNNEKFIEETKMRKEDFTRNRKHGFSDTVIMVLNKTGKSLQTGIHAFMKSMKEESENYSKQAFSKGRMRIKYEAFQKLFRMSVDEFYKGFHTKTFKGYRVSAVDGTKLNLPYNEQSIEEFGIQKGTGNQIQALASCLYDVQNEIIIDAVIEPYDSSEIKLAQQHLDFLSSISNDKELLTFDRGYPSSELISNIESNGFYYLMRCNSSFANCLKKEVAGDDCIITHKFQKTKIEIRTRCIKFILPNGTTEFLITNIFDQDFSVSDFKTLYHKRWEIETNYDDIKNKLEIENFSGTSPLAVRQDFFATMFLRNLASMMIFENAADIDRLHNSSDNKYSYKANVNNVISILKTDLIQMLITDSNRKRKLLFRNIYNQISYSVVPIRPDRSFLRKKKHFSSKFPQNQKN